MTTLLNQAAALMLTGMLIVFGMLVALIGVVALNARMIRRFKLDPAPSKASPTAAAIPVVGVIAAAIQAHEDLRSADTQPQ